MKYWFFPVAGLAVFFLAFWAPPALGQSNTARLFTAADGLPLSEASSVFTDSRGRLWVSTSGGGISLYEGKGFRNFTTRDGLVTMTFYALWEDRDQRIWALNQEYGLSCREGERWQSWSFDDLRSDVPRVASDLTSQATFALDKNFNLFRVVPGQINLRWIEKFPFDSTVLTIGDLQSWDDGQSIFLILDYRDKSAPREMWLRQGSHPWRMIMPGPGIAPALPVSDSWIIPGEGVFVFLDGRIHRYDGQRWYLWETPVMDFDPQTKGLLSPRMGWTDKLFFVRKRSHGRMEIQQYDPGFTSIRRVTLHNRHDIGQACMDRGGHFWLATRGGLYRIFPYFLSLTEADSGMVTDLHALMEDLSGHIWLASYKEGMVRFDGEALHPAPPDLVPFRRFMPGSFRDKAGNLYFSHEASPGGIVSGRPGGRWSVHPLQEPCYFMGAFRNGDLGLGLGGRQGIMRCPVNPLSGQVDLHRSTQLGKAKGLKLQNVLSFCEDTLGRIWMGRTSQGLAVWLPDRDTILNFIRQDTNAFYGAMSIVDDQHGNLWFATNQGLRFWKSRPVLGEEFDPVKEFIPVGRETLGDLPVNLLGRYSDRYLIFGNTRGFGLVDLETFYGSDMKRPRIYFFSEKEGYTGGSTEQNAIWVDRRNRIWIGCDAGVLRFDPAFFHPDTLPPLLEVDSVIAGGRTWTGSATRKCLLLDAADRIIRIALKPPPNLFPCDHLEFRYRRAGGLDTGWTTVGNSTVFQLENLGVGQYLIEIQSVKNSVPTESLWVEFEIPLFFWQEIYFWMAIIAVLGLLTFFFWRRERQLQVEKRERNKLEVQLIVNQLNPHFINNALQLVQVRIYQDQESVRVIDKLAHNIHLIFTNSRDKRPFFSLEEEMLLLRNYLYIQQMRFGPNLICELPPEEQIKRLGWIQLPLMQIQIHVENAIEHGIRNQPDGRGRVSVGLTDAGPLLHITVEDTGVGRARARKLNSRGTQQGTKMLDELHAIFNRYNLLPIRSSYEDDVFVDAAGLVYGTRVQIYIPKSYRYALD